MSHIFECSLVAVIQRMGLEEMGATLSFREMTDRRGALDVNVGESLHPFKGCDNAKSAGITRQKSLSIT